MANTVFREESIKKVTSPEELNDYVKVARPGIWLVLSAIIVLLTAVLVWGIFGSLDTTVSLSGVCRDGEITCFTTSVGGLAGGQRALCGGKDTAVGAISEVPISREAAAQLCADEYTAYCMNLSDWNYTVTFAASGCPDGIVSVQVTTDSVSPLSFLWN